MRLSPWFLLFALAAASKRRAIAWGSGWCWPVPTLQLGALSYEATVSSGFESTRHGRPHRGLDIMYRRRKPAGDDYLRYPPGERDADGFASTKNYFAPPGTPILAAKDGKVWSVHHRDDGGGISVVLDHGKPWATYYTHLLSTTLAAHKSGKQSDGSAAQRVAAGEVIGVMGGNLSDSERVRHLHFECWYQGSGSDSSIDAKAEGVMSTWERKRWQPRTP